MPRLNHTATSRSEIRYTNVPVQSSVPTLPPASHPIQHQSRPSWWTRIGVDHWVWELSAAVLCVCVLAAIVGVLIGYDQRPVPDLPDGLTEASRGPYGALVLILKRRGSLRALLAAIVTVLAIGFEPFLQQIITISTHVVSIDGAIASIQTPTGYNEASTNGSTDSALAFTAQIGAFGGVNGTTPVPTCPGGNCTWPEYNSLALCTICKDMTGQISVTNPFNINVTTHLVDFEHGNESSAYQEWHPTYAFPNGYNLTVDVGLSMYNGTNSYISTQYDIGYPRRRVWPLNISPAAYSIWNRSWRNETYADLASPLFVMGSVDFALAEDCSSLRVEGATECVFSPCVRTISTESVNGVISSSISHVDYGTIFFDEQLADGSSIAGGWRTRVNNTDYELFDKGATSNAGGNASRIIQALRTTLEGNTTYGVEGFYYPDGPYESIPPSDSTGYAVGSAWSSSGQQAIDVADNFTKVVNDVGQAITGRFQQLAQSSVTGTATRNEAIIEVRWLWLIYPLALLVLGLFGLIATIIATHIRHMAVWKESTLPLLYRYMSASGAPGNPAGNTRIMHASALNNVSQIVDQAQEEMVRLRRHKTVWTLDSESVAERRPAVDDFMLEERQQHLLHRHGDQDYGIGIAR